MIRKLFFTVNLLFLAFLQVDFAFSFSYSFDKRIFFEENSYRFKLNGPNPLLCMATVAVNPSNVVVEKIVIAGHADKNESNPKRLSQRRAQTIVNYFLGHGVKPEMLEMRRFGAKQPISDGTTSEGRAKNRRVDMVPYMYFHENGIQKPYLDVNVQWPRVCR